MRILVVSDSHGNFKNLMRAVQAQPTAEIIIHCGDGAEQTKLLKQSFKDKMIVAVKGNCDLASSLPVTETLRVCGKTIMITHGHMFNVKVGYYHLMRAAKEAKADIVTFGHTHIPFEAYEEGLYMLNPGSCGGYMASYGYIDITDNGEIITNTVDLK